MTMNSAFSTNGYLTGQLLVAMPQMRDVRFTRTVIYVCAHNADGAMGLVLNRLVESISFPALLAQLGIDSGDLGEEIRVHFGGPVESGRGFVLHSADYVHNGTMLVDEGVALTASIDILKDMADGTGPRHSLLALGYAGWGPGQLDAEMQANGWLSVPPDEQLIFGNDLDTKWEHAIGKIGIDINQLSGEAGHA
ncbi:YqgE/AlgH family protein [Rhodospirillaceae bacterium SYSU D60014]|uniref:YqgE/AlgH family protein n=1 Tax=Virgifigura deserti TaxID=2268457 RepID=UPI000E6746C5